MLHLPCSMLRQSPERRKINESVQNCLCCGKPLRTADESGWHKACIKNFFGTSTLPEIEIDEDTLNVLAVETTNKGFTVPGVQKKLSLHLLSDSRKPRLTFVNYPTGYILKPQVTEYEALPKSEQLVMTMAAMAEFYIRLIFCFIVGNSDMHFKNFSLIETTVGSGEYVLSPAYDLLPVNANIPADKEQFALAMNEKKMNIRRSDFLKFAVSCDIPCPTAEKNIDNLVRSTPKWLTMCENSLLPDPLKKRLLKIIMARTEILKQ